MLTGKHAWTMTWYKSYTYKSCRPNITHTSRNWGIPTPQMTLYVSWEVYRVTVKRCCWFVRRSSNSWRCLLARLSFCYASHSSICWLTPPHKERIAWYSRESRIPGFALFMKHCVRRPSKMEIKHPDPFGPYLAIQKKLYKRERKRTEK